MGAYPGIKGKICGEGEERMLRPVPEFENEDQERAFWAANDSTDYLEMVVVITSENYRLREAHQLTDRLLGEFVLAAVSRELRQ
jgi:hypothetical protein